MTATTTGRAIAWALLALACLANIAGYAFDLYRQFWWFDRVLHGSTMLALTFWLAIVVLGRALKADPPHPVLAFFLLAAAGVAIGALWEVAEWGYDLFAPGNAIKGKYDTIMDINMDTLGAVLASLAALRFMRPGAGAKAAGPLGEERRRLRALSP